MGLKGDSDRKNRPVPTGEQLRLAKLTAEGPAGDEDQENMKRLIRKVIETTLCTKAQAEIALFDNDNDVDAAVIQILENPNEDWTEQKTKKEKKKEEEIRPVRGQSSTRGRSQWSERQSGRGRSSQGAGQGGTSVRGPSRGAAQNGRSRGGNRQNARVNPEITSLPKGTLEDEETNKDWKTGPLVFKRSDENTPPATTATPSAATVSVPAVPAPISFAAVAAAGANKEKQRQQQAREEAAPTSVLSEEPAASVSVEPEEEPLEEVPAIEPEPSAPSPLPEAEVDTSTLHAAVEWTNQLKNDLGIGVSASNVQFTSAPEPSLPLQTVEFVSEAAPSAAAALPEYQFGFHIEPAVPRPTESSPPAPAAAPPTPVVQPSEASLFSRSPVGTSNQPSTAVHVPPKPVEPEPRRTDVSTDFSMMKSSPPTVPPASAYGQHMQQTRTLSYDTSSVSYPPQERQTAMSMPKQQPPVTLHSQQQNPAASQQQQQMAFPAAPQMPYGSYPYLGMYSPVTAGLRDDAGYAAAALMQYPFGMGQIDLSAILPQGSLSGGQSQPSAQPQHRSDSHGLMDLNKFPSGVTSSRDNSVAPPPGFGTPNAFMPPQPSLQNLFMQQQYPTGPFPFMMPSVNQGRPMYGASGDDDRQKGGAYDKMGKGGAQQTPPPHYQQHNGYLGGLGKPKQSQQPYGHSGWNN